MHLRSDDHRRMHRRPRLAACGGDDETTSTSSTTTPTGATGTDTTGDVDTSDLPEASTLREQFNQQLLQILTSARG